MWTGLVLYVYYMCIIFFRNQQESFLHSTSLDPLVNLIIKSFKLFDFLIFWLWAYLMKVIPETCRVH